MFNNRWVVLILVIAVIVGLMILLKVNFSGQVGMGGKTATVAVG